VWVTGEVLVAASREDFPVSEVSRAPRTTAPSTVSPPSAAPGPPAVLPEVIAPSPAPAPAPSGGGAASPPSSGGGQVPATPLIPESSAPPPEFAPGEEPTPQGDGLAEGSPTASLEEGDDPASPWIPIGIGAGVGLLALVLPVALGKRYAW
jgi:hypothetical protein